jgi:hypothetical protein
VNKIPKYLILSCLLLGSSIGLFSQQQNLPLNREFNLINQKVFNSFGNNTHTSFQPINQSFIQIDSITGISKSEHKYYLTNISKSEKKPRNFFGWMYRSIFYDNFLAADTGNLYLTVDPLLDWRLHKDNEDQSGWHGGGLWPQTRGVIVRGNVGEKFSFETSFYENQFWFPNYMSNYIEASGVVPGQGRWKPVISKRTGMRKENYFDYASSSATITYSPAKFINFQMGSGKHFIGDGYRSLLLSDASFNYPFWKITTTFGKKNQFQPIILVG